MFEGSYVAIVTPFKDNKVDFECLKKLIEFHIKNGINGIVPCGTTGESVTLSYQEHEQVIDFVVKTVAGRIKVIAGTGSNSTTETIEMTAYAKKSGADGVLLVSPYYNKPTQKGLYLHFKKVADEIDIPIMLYNIQSRTAVNIEPETVAKLHSDCKNIVAIKEASGSLEQMTKIQILYPKIDMLSISGHKLHAPKGIGVLFLRKGARFSPFMMGGHQERGRRAGTENVPYIVGLGIAAELALKNLDAENTRVKALRDRLEAGLLKTIPNTRVNGGGADRLPNTLHIGFEYVEGESILIMLSEKGICASSGSACTSGSLEPSHVMMSMGVPQTYAHGTVRFSFSVYNTDADVDAVLKELPPVIARLREISPFADGKPLFGMDACDAHHHH